MKRDYNMKNLARLLALVSMITSIYEMYKGRTDGSILFIVWSFYLRYLSDKSE